MKIAVIGATGFVGSHIINELASRNFQVLGISRKKQESLSSLISYEAIDVNKLANLIEAVKGYDVVVNAFNPGWSNPNIYHEFLEGSKNILAAVKLAGVKRFISIGGAGSLYVSEGGPQVLDTFPSDSPFFPGAKAAKEFLDYLQEETSLDWTFFSPAIEMHQGVSTGRTGKYRLGTDYPVVDNQGKNVLSGEDLAVVIVDEIESPKHYQMRFTAAY